MLLLLSIEQEDTHYFSLMHSRQLRRAAPNDVSLSAGIWDFKNIYDNTVYTDRQYLFSGFCLWIIKCDSSVCFATSWNIQRIFLLLAECLLSYINHLQGNWQLWLPRSPLTADAFQEVHSFGCYAVRHKVHNILCFVCGFQLARRNL